MASESLGLSLPWQKEEEERESDSRIDSQTREGKKDRGSRNQNQKARGSGKREREKRGTDWCKRGNTRQNCARTAAELPRVLLQLLVNPIDPLLLSIAGARFLLLLPLSLSLSSSFPASGSRSQHLSRTLLAARAAASAYSLRPFPLATRLVRSPHLSLSLSLSVEMEAAASLLRQQFAVHRSSIIPPDQRSLPLPSNLELVTHAVRPILAGSCCGHLCHKTSSCCRVCP